jgi:hypothetical protein
MARTLAEAEALIKMYEENGIAKLAYSLNRKMNEMADILNKNSLGSLELTDAKDKTFDRLKATWSSAAEVAASFKTLSELAGITGDEGKDIAKKPFIERIADSRQ